MKKTFWSIILTVTLLLISCNIAMADDTRTSGLFSYSIKGNGSVTITGFDWENNKNEDVYIPSMIDGYTVSSIGDMAFMRNERANEIKVTLPDTITTIGEKAFWNCNISEINIPASVKKIGYGAFVGNYCQFKIVPNHDSFAVIDGNLYDKKQKELLFGLTGKEVPEGIVSIGDYAYYEKTFRTTDQDPFAIYMPSSLEKIGNYAFYGAAFSASDNNPTAHKKFFVFPKGIKTIGEYAFCNTSFSLAMVFKSLNKTQYGVFEINMPNTLENLGVAAFMDVHGGEINTTGVNMPKFVFSQNSKLTEIPDYCFYRQTDFPFTDLTSVELHMEVKKIGNYAFDGVSFINISVSADHPETIEDIGVHAGCGSIFETPSSFSSKITVIPEGLNPKTSELPDTVTEIASKAFKKRTDFKLSSALTNIATDAFAQGSTFIVESGTYAELWCQENGFGYSIEGENSLDWLNN